SNTSAPETTRTAVNVIGSIVPSCASAIRHKSEFAAKPVSASTVRTTSRLGTESLRPALEREGERGLHVGLRLARRENDEALADRRERGRVGDLRTRRRIVLGQHVR